MANTEPHPPLFGDPESSRALQMVRPLRRVPLLAKLLGSFFIIGPFTLASVPWQQNLAGTGRVVAYGPLERQQRVEASIDGRVVRWWVQEGSIVKKGDPLVEISDIDPDLTQRLEQERTAVEAKLIAYTDKIVAYEQQVVNLEATRDLAVSQADFYVKEAAQKVISAQATLEADKRALDVAQDQFTRSRNLYDDGIVSERDFQVADRELEAARAKVQSSQASLEGARNNLDGLKANLEKTRADSNSKIDSARASLNEARGQVEEAKASLAKLQVGISRQQSRRITAPRDGTIFRLTANQDGEIVKIGDPLAIIVPDTEERAVELWLTGNDAPLVSPGDHVRLQFEGWPAVQFAGWPSVAIGTFGGKVALIDSTDDGKGKFRLLVVPDDDRGDKKSQLDRWPSTRFLRQGVRAKGWVLLNQVSIGYEIWRQINGFPPVIAMEEPQSDVARKRIK